MSIDFPLTVDIEESRRLIDQQKAELYKMIQQLNSRRNELAPISVLPPELLARIFTFITASRTPITPYLFVDYHYWSFTYVSQHWRNVALDTPGLWDTPTFASPEWARAMLERSKMVDLVVHCNATLVTNHTLIKEVFENHASRIRELWLDEFDPSSLSSILQNAQPSSLCLRSLRLSQDGWSHNDEPTPASSFPVFPAHLLAQPDSLRHLVIESCAFDLYAQPRPLLTYLSVGRPRDRPLLSEFITALSGMPELETLEMINALPLAKNAVKSALKVRLPKLSSLHLSSMNAFEVLNVVDFLIVPWTTKVKFELEHSSDAEIRFQLSDIVSPLRLFFSSMTGNAERKVYERLRLHDRNGIGLSAWKDEKLHDSDMPDLDLLLECDIRSINLLTEILSPFDFQTLSINGNYGEGAYSFFGQSTTIQTVELQSGPMVYNFLEALTHKPEGYERLESSYYSVSFPALRSLMFHRTSFFVDTLEQVLDCLMERYERGAPLEKLRICNCYNIGEEDVRLLREIVPDVEWDEIVLRDESESESEYEHEYSDGWD